MDSAPTSKQLTHDRIVDTAARSIRASGLHGVGVADIMKQAGLTHGGFYAHFASRNALVAEALAHAGQQSRERLRAAIEAGEAKGHSRFRALVEGYLHDRNLKSCESGCPVAALGSEMARQDGEVRQASALRVQSLFATVANYLPGGHGDEAPSVIAGQLVGALQLARTLGDNAQGRAVLAATRRALLDQYESPPRARA